MVQDFPVDYMHQVCFGVMKTLLLTWMRGPRANNRMSSDQIGTKYVRNCVSCTLQPQEIARKPRVLEEVDKWKATDSVNFLYTLDNLL